MMHKGCSAWLGLALTTVPCGAAVAALTISPQPTVGLLCANGICRPTTADAVLNASDLEAMLAVGSVTVFTQGDGKVQAHEIEVDAPVTWSSGTALQLQASQSIRIDRVVSLKGASSLALRTGPRSADLLTFGSHGHVSVGPAAAVVINGKQFKRVEGLPALIAAINRHPAGNFALANDYDAVADGVYASSPIGVAFAGVFQGLGHTIRNVAIKDENVGFGAAGLFSTLDQRGSIEGLRLDHIRYRFRCAHSQSIGGGQVGGLAGTSTGLMVNDRVQGSLAAVACDGGGLVGTGSGSIYASSTNVTLKAHSAGGIAGLWRGLISQSAARGNVVATGYDGYAGGLVAHLYGVIAQSHFNGNVTAGTHAHPTYSYMGGLVGAAEGNILDCYARGEVNAGENPSPIANGGLIGFNTAIVVRSYAANSTYNGAGFVGYTYAAGQDDYWDTSTGGSYEGGGGVIATGLSTAQLKSGLPPGFDPTVWQEAPGVNDGFPFLKANHPNLEQP